METPVSISALLLHYYGALLLYENVWIQSSKNPIVYRYIDWTLTVPFTGN